MCFKKKEKPGSALSYESYRYADTKEEEYIKIRLLPQIKYYSKASGYLQKEYYILSIINTIFMAAVPIILMLPSTAEWAKYVSAIISAIASVLSSILLIKRTKENWLEYRTTSEALKSEFATFKARSAEYQTEDHSQRFSLFVERCERIMQVERTGWYSRMKMESDQTYGVNGASEETGS